MDFLIINKKNTFSKSCIDYNYLFSNVATTANSFAVFSRCYKDFDVFVYPHIGVKEDVEGREFLLTENQCLITVGYVHYEDGGIRPESITDFFSEIDKGRGLDGDFQLIKMTSDGCGYIKGSTFGWRQLYCFSDDNVFVLASSIKLIVDSIKKIHSNLFIKNFDFDFIGDSYFRAWTGRKHHRNTLFKQIKKIYPFDEVVFDKGNVLIRDVNNIIIPDGFNNVYFENKEIFYNSMFDKLDTFIKNVFEFDFKEINQVRINLTGGLDSRAILALLYNFCKKK